MRARCHRGIADAPARAQHFTRAPRSAPLAPRSSRVLCLGRADVVKLESGKDDAERKDFWEALGATERAGVRDASAGELTPEVEAVRVPHLAP